MKSLVTGLTISRILLAPLIFILTVFFENFWAALILFMSAALTDYLDGKLARRYRVQSKLGEILDPIADKVLIVFVILSVIIITKDGIIALMGAFILAREFWVSALREFTRSNNNSSTTKVTFLAKTKTTTQFIALSMYFFAAAADLALVSFIANFVLFIAILLAYKSALNYNQNVFRN